MTAAFEVRGVRVAYGSHTVLDVESLGLWPGRTLAILGPNGSGKSTLLRILALLERPTAGSLTLLGQPVGTRERQRLGLRRRMATVFQDPLLTDQTVAANVALGLRFRGLPEAGTRDRVRRWLTRLGIIHLADRPARTLSGGEAQRVSLARALVVEPELLFLDEPFASLDQHGREALILELEAILGESRIATVLVTHDHAEAMMLADESAVLMGGRVRQAGPVHDVLARPVDGSMARFLGVENVLPARLIRRSGERGEIELAGVRFEAAIPPGANGPVLVCLRAEEVHLSPPGTAAEPGSVRLPARVVRKVPFGVPYRLQLDGGVPLVALAARRTVDRLKVEPGAMLVVSFDPHSVHVVPSGSEERKGSGSET